MSKFIALVPMKGHSRRVPNKNLKEFNGCPLYHAIMNTLLDCDSISQIYVDTDSPEIKEDIHRNFETVTTINRPEKIQGDHVSMNKVIRHDLSVIDAEYFLQTHSTNPLLSSKTIEDAINLFFREQQYDSVFSVTRWQTRLYWENGEPINHNPDELKRTQDLKPVFEENSNFYLFSRESFQNAGDQRIGNKPYMYPVDKLESIDIDEPEDFTLAEILHSRQNQFES